jgi:hypothetical protein
VAISWLETVVGVALGVGLASVLKEERPRPSPAYDPPLPRLDVDRGLPAASLVSLVDGGVRRIDRIEPGDRILGRGGAVTVSDVRLQRPYAGPLHTLNGGFPLLAPGQPVLTLEGWKAIRPEGLAERNPGVAIGRLGVGDFVAMAPAQPQGPADPLPPEDGEETKGRYLDFVLVESLMASDQQAEEAAFNLRLEGAPLFYANQLLVHALPSAG